jgi:hypothetical protein
MLPFPGSNRGALAIDFIEESAFRRARTERSFVRSFVTLPRGGGLGTPQLADRVPRDLRIAVQVVGLQDAAGVLVAASGDGAGTVQPAREHQPCHCDPRT